MNSEKEILAAIDIVCLNCVEDTLNNEHACDNCPVRKLAGCVGSPMATLYFRRSGAYRSDFWSCYSIKQALMLGEQKFRDSGSDIMQWSFLHVESGGKIIKDWING